MLEDIYIHTYTNMCTHNMANWILRKRNPYHQLNISALSQAFWVPSNRTPPVLRTSTKNMCCDMICFWVLPKVMPSHFRAEVRWNSMLRGWMCLSSQDPSSCLTGLGPLCSQCHFCKSSSGTCVTLRNIRAALGFKASADPCFSQKYWLQLLWKKRKKEHYFFEICSSRCIVEWCLSYSSHFGATGTENILSLFPFLFKTALTRFFF